MVILRKEQVRSLDSIAVERFGIPSIVLMENAGKGATESLLRMIPEMKHPPPILRPPSEKTTPSSPK